MKHDTAEEAGAWSSEADGIFSRQSRTISATGRGGVMCGLRSRLQCSLSRKLFVHSCNTKTLNGFICADFTEELTGVAHPLNRVFRSCLMVEKQEFEVINVAHRLVKQGLKTQTQTEPVLHCHTLTFRLIKHIS